jgi:FMN phosphatase YigB (HAD superfamily)
MIKIFNDFFEEQKLGPGGGERHPEIQADKIWEGVIKRLLQKDYKFDAGQYGSLNEYCKKIAYFYHASLQATQCYPTVDRALAHVAAAGVSQGLLGDGQCFTPTQLQRGLAALGSTVQLDNVIPPAWRFLSYEYRAKKPSDRIMRPMFERLAEWEIELSEVLYIGSRIVRDIVPMKKLGMKTALFAGDRASLAATADQLKDPASKPDLLLTEPGQIADVIG